MKKIFRFGALLLMITVTAFLTLALLSSCKDKEPEEKKAVIIVPGLCGSAFIETETGEAVWDPMNGEVAWDDLYNEEGGFGGNKEAMIKIYETIGKVIFHLGDEQNFFTRLSIGEDGLPEDKTVLPANMETEGVLKYGAVGVYKNLYTAINERYGKDREVTLWQYDWRVDVNVHAQNLQNFINEKQYTDVALIGHSMGGVVISKYLSLSEENRNKTSMFISLATPFFGSMTAVGLVLNPSGLLANFVPSEVLSVLEEPVNNVLGSLFKNSYVGYQMFPFKEFYGAPYFEEGDSCIKFDGMPATYEDTDEFLRTQDWSNLSTGGLRPAIANNSSYQDSVFFTVDGQRKHVSELVNTYYFVARGKLTNLSFNWSPAGTSEMISTLDGDGMVTVFSGTVGRPDAGNVFIYDGCGHADIAIDLDTYIKNDLFSVMDKLG